MKNTITMTTKGTFTLPAEIRSKLEVNKKGDKLAISYDKTKQQVIISKPIDIATLQLKMSLYTKNKKPLTDVSGYYKKRKPRI